MHRDFISALRPDGTGLDYTKLQSYDTAAVLESLFEQQRPAGREWLQGAIRNRNMKGLGEALNNARRIGLEKTDPELILKGKKLLNGER
jgi:hypothetical protein